VITMMKIRGGRAPDELTDRTKQGQNPATLESGREEIQQRDAKCIKIQSRKSWNNTRNDNRGSKEHRSEHN
jgi:hypothetical protein